MDMYAKRSLYFVLSSFIYIYLMSGGNVYKNYFFELVNVLLTCGGSFMFVISLF